MTAMGKVRGQPLVALLAVLGGWIGGRAAGWEAPAPIKNPAGLHSVETAPPSADTGFVFDGRVGPQSIGRVPSSPYGTPFLFGGGGNVQVPAAVAMQYGGPAVPAGWMTPINARPLMVWNPAGSVWGPSAAMFMPRGPRAIPDRDNGFSHANFLAPEAAPFPAPFPTPFPAGDATPPVPGHPARAKRWSIDTWAMLRNDVGATLSPGIAPATYGASQSGAIVRYRLALSDNRRPFAYARTTSALAGVRENAAAIGLGMRPVPSIPVVAAVEERLMDQSGQRHFQPAAFAYTELPPIALPAHWRAETYLQAGYVGGRFATLFADGQARLDRELARLGSLETRFGGGVWGGVQKGAARLDIGPTAALTAPLGKGMFGRAAVDWRFRVAGGAEPGSGPALTLSAGF